MNEGGVEAPGEPLGEGGGGHLGRPVVVGGVAVASKTVLRERLHQSVELRSEPSLAKVRAGINQMSFPLPPFCPSVLEPNLKESWLSAKYNIHTIPLTASDHRWVKYFSLLFHRGTNVGSMQSELIKT